MISQLHHALSDLKIDQPIHEWVQKAGKLPTYIVALNEEGMPVSIRPRTADSSFWRVHKSNHSIFPLLKIQRDKSASRALMQCVGFSRELESRLTSLKPLIQRIMRIEDANAWFKALEEIKRQAIKDGVLRADEQATDAYIVLELPTAEHWGCAIDSDEMRLVYSRELTDTDPSAHIGVCALTGKESALEKWKYPNPNLPVLGITYLQSMNADIPCLMRYRAISTDYYPVSKEALRALNSRLTEITKKDWEGKTWSKVSVDGKKALLIAHTDTGQGLQLAELFASESAELYAHVCKKVVDGLRAHCARGANPEIVKLIVLREIDPGRKGVEFVQQIHSDVLVRNVERISKIIRNAPHFMVAITAQGRIIKNAITPQAVSPVEISLELNQQWLRHGDGRATVHGNHLEEAINLLTSADVQATADRLLSVMCQRSLPLLAYSKGNIKAKGRALSVLYLLRRLSDGGELMETIGFKLGRYLSVCDWLHKAYCDHVRDGSYPNQLLGNSYFQQFADRPEKGLASMALRLSPYLAWGKGRGANEAGGIVGTLGKIATEISEMGVPRKLGDSGRADLLLGYLYQKPKADAADAVQ